MRRIYGVILASMLCSAVFVIGYFMYTREQKIDLEAIIDLGGESSVEISDGDAHYEKKTDDTPLVVKESESVCEKIINKTIIEDLLNEFDGMGIQYSVDHSKENPALSIDDMVYGFTVTRPCSTEVTIIGAIDNLGENWSTIIRDELLKKGWSDTYGQSVRFGSRELVLYPVIADGPLSHITTFIHAPQELEPYLQFLQIQESTKVSGQDENEGFFCPCSLEYHLILSNQYLTI